MDRKCTTRILLLRWCAKDAAWARRLSLKIRLANSHKTQHQSIQQQSDHHPKTTMMSAAATNYFGSQQRHWQTAPIMNRAAAIVSPPGWASRSGSEILPAPALSNGGNGGNLAREIQRGQLMNAIGDAHLCDRLRKSDLWLHVLK